jgi:pSer/pThr/pTyr-binding forkhead associated (FHA) protein
MKLELTNRDRSQSPIVLDQLPVIVGLDAGADICLDDSSVGHYQCMIDDSDGVLMVWDLGTKLGTTINGVRISQKAPLMSGDELGIGRNRFVVCYDDRAAKRFEAAGQQTRDSSSSAVSPRRRQPAVPV